MIWFWILLAILLSLFLCKGKSIRWEHYIWMLFPIELYGLTLGGATIKPYMIYGAIIFLAQLLENGSKIPVLPSLYILIGFIFATDLLNGFVTESIMQHILFAAMCVILVTYLFRFDWDKENREQLASITTATVIGFGIIFIIAYLLASSGVEINGIYTTVRTENGIVMGFSEIGGGYTTRLRGFTIDPNACITAFIPGCCFAIYDLMSENGERRLRNVTTIIVFSVVAIMTSSRNALILVIALAAVAIVLSYRRTKNKVLWITVFCIVILLLLADALIVDNGITSTVNTYLMDSFSSRSSATDTDGRLNIWRTNLSAWLDSDGILFGVGQNQIQNYTTLGMECHNTWLEWLCGTGILVGPCICLWFLSASFRALGRMRNGTNLVQMYLPLILSHIALIVCLTTVDHIANPTFLAVSILLQIFATEHDTADQLATTYGSSSYEKKI